MIKHDKHLIVLFQETQTWKLKEASASTGSGIRIDQAGSQCQESTHWASGFWVPAYKWIKNLMTKHDKHFIVLFQETEAWKVKEAFASTSSGVRREQAGSQCQELLNEIQKHSSLLLSPMGLRAVADAGDDAEGGSGSIKSELEKLPLLSHH